MRRFFFSLQLSFSAFSFHLHKRLIDFLKRSYEKELLDRDDIPFKDIRRNMEELDFINTYLGGHAITITGFKTLLRHSKKGIVSICEIGCGGGDNLRILNKYCQKKNISGQFIGIDI